MKINKLLESKKLKEGITRIEPALHFQGKSSHTFTTDKRWEVDFDEAGNILARTRHGKPYYFKGHINDKVNNFPYTDEDNIILAAREQHGLKFGNKEVKEGYSHFEFTSGSNPYIAKTKDEAERIKRSRGDSVKYVGNINGIDYYKVDDSEKDLFRVDDLDEASIPRNATRLRATHRYGDKETMELSKDGTYWRTGNDNKAYPSDYLRKYYDVEVLDTDPNYKPNRTKPEYVVQGNYGYGWEDLTASDDYSEARNDLKAYRENETGVPHRLITRRVPITENLKEAFKPSDSGIQSVKCYNRYNYTIQELRVDNDNKTFERGNFTAGKADKKTKNRQEYEDIVDSLKELGYTEIKSGYNSMRNKSRKGIPTVESKSIKTFDTKGKKLNEGTDSWLLVKNNNWYDPEGLNIEPPQRIICQGTKEECTREFNKIVADAKKDDGSRWVSIEELSDSHIKIYYPMAVTKAVYQLIPNTKNESLSEGNLRNEKGQVMADKWYASKYPDDEIGIEQLEGITLDDALKDRSILGHCDTQVRERVYAQLDKYIPLSKDSPMFKKVNESSEGFQKEFYNGYVILKNRAGEGWDIYSYDGTPEKVTKAYLEDEGFATLQAAKDEIDKWLEESKLDESTLSISDLKTFYNTSTSIDKEKYPNFFEWYDDMIRRGKFKMESMNEASYGGAFDIADDQYFTRDDLNDFAEEVLNHINETFKTPFDVSSCYIDNGILELCVTNDEYGDYIHSEKIDMRKIKEPWHLKRAYAFEFASQLINDITQSNDGLIESVSSSSHEFDDDVDDLSYYYDDETFKDNLENSPYTEIASKSVTDSDGFITDYTMYMNINTGEYVFVFGDKDVYSPEDGYFDWECDTKEEAEEWFNSYNGFADEDEFEVPWGGSEKRELPWNNYDEMNEDVEKSPIVHKKSDGSYLVTAENGDGYVAYNKDDVCMGNISANNENEAKNKFNSNQFDE